MLSSDQNIETISQLIEMVKHNIELRKEYTKLDVVENLPRQEQQSGCRSSSD